MQRQLVKVIYARALIRKPNCRRTGLQKGGQFGQMSRLSFCLLRSSDMTTRELYGSIGVSGYEHQQCWRKDGFFSMARLVTGIEDTCFQLIQE